MTDIWDELCEEFDEALSMQEYVVPKSLIGRWNKIKAEGGRLKEKAEKWDKYTLDGKNIPPEIIEQIEELEQKLEAIHNELAQLHSSGSGYMTGDAIDGIRKILEDQTSRREEKK